MVFNLSQLLKRILPPILLGPLIKIKNWTINPISKFFLIKTMQKNNSIWIENLKKKKKIKVIFLVIHESMWKVDPVFRKMLDDPFFEPEILVCPYTRFGEEAMLSDLHKAFRYFQEKGYPVKKSLCDGGEWLGLSELKPDIVCFTNPNDLTRAEYYNYAFRKYLAFYIPYYYMATNHTAHPKAELNKPIFNAIWRIYWPHEYIFRKFSQISQIKGKNSVLTGYPASEPLITGRGEDRESVWKAQPKKKKRIIYAPHHTIADDKLSLSTFLQLGMVVKKVAECNKESVQWSFKPHPMLKPKLYRNPDWGREKTDIYYNFWSIQDYTQLDEGEYESLFIQSDAIIHDCSSFLVEYAVLKKPALYLMNRLGVEHGLLNEFGKCAFQSYQTAASADEIKSFVDSVVEGDERAAGTENGCLDDYIVRFYSSELPSDRVISDIKVALDATSH